MSNTEETRAEFYRAVWIIKRLLHDPFDLPNKLLAEKFIRDVKGKIADGLKEATATIREAKRNEADQDAEDLGCKHELGR